MNRAMNLIEFPLVAPADQFSGTHSRVIRILRAGYICEIIRDSSTEPPIYHWVVQGCESNDVVGLGQSHTFSEAESTAIWLLDELRLRRAI